MHPSMDLLVAVAAFAGTLVGNHMLHKVTWTAMRVTVGVVLMVMAAEPGAGLIYRTIALRAAVRCLREKKRNLIRQRQRTQKFLRGSVALR